MDQNGGDEKRLAEPKILDQKVAEKRIKELFKADYARRSAGDLRNLAQKLLRTGIETADDPTARFVLLREAREAGAHGGDFLTAFAAIDETAKMFAIDVLGIKAGLVLNPKPTVDSECGKAFVEACMIVTDDAVRAENFELAQKLAARAEGTAKTSPNPMLVAQAQARGRQVQEIFKESKLIKAAEKTLSERPDDPAACLAVGRFKCLVKGDWSEKALRMLAGSSDAMLKELAEKELAKPTVSEAQAELAERWWTLAEKEKNANCRSHLLDRAKTWFEGANSGLTGLARAKAEKRLAAIARERAGPLIPLDLLKMVDLRTDIVKGNWTLRGKTVECSGGDPAKLQLPYMPPEEYDLKIVATRTAGPVIDFFIGLAVGEKQFLMAFDGLQREGPFSGLCPINGKWVKDNETTIKGQVLPDGKPFTVICSVRKDRVAVTVDGKTIVNWNANYGLVGGMPANFVIPNRKVLYIGLWDGRFSISEITLIPVSGPGSSLR